MPPAVAPPALGSAAPCRPRPAGSTTAVAHACACLRHSRLHHTRPQSPTPATASRATPMWLLLWDWSTRLDRTVVTIFSRRRTIGLGAGADGGTGQCSEAGPLLLDPEDQPDTEDHNTD